MSSNSARTIVLLGYMGSGKSTVGQHLAAILHSNFTDLDDYLETQEGSTITKIMEEKGAIYFRKKERFYMQQVLKDNKNKILALGGGTPCYYNNMESINNINDSTSIYLRGTVPFLTQRLFEEREHRPLIASIDDKNELAEFIGKHLLERSIYYNQAHITVSIENKPVAQIVEEITNLILM
jgi:shikimate kinase